MKYAYLPALGAALALAIATPAAAQQRHSTQWRTQSAGDASRKHATEAARREFLSYSRCFVDKRYDRARSIVLAPYSSAEQSNAARKAAVRSSGNDACFQGLEDMSMSFQADVLVGGLAQALVLKDYPDLPRLVGGFTVDPADEATRVKQLNAAEIFGRCIVQRDPVAAMALLSSTPATPGERQAVNLLRDDLGQCLAAGSTITINEMFLRNVTAVAAYRLGQQIQPRGTTGGGSA
jgi:hypothetical protein